MQYLRIAIVLRVVAAPAISWPQEINNAPGQSKAVQLFFTASTHGKPLDALSPDEVKIIDQKVKQSRLLDLKRGQEFPLHIGILLDTSSSAAVYKLNITLGQEQELINVFLKTVVQPSTRVSLFQFAKGAANISGTNDRAGMQQASIQRSNTEQEILQVVEEYRSEVTRAAGQSVRRVLIVMCNGGALLGRDTLAKIEEVSLRDGVMVYPIDAAHRPISGTTGPGDISHQNADLSATINGLMETSRASFRDWAEKTGGIYFEVDNSSEIKRPYQKSLMV